MFYISVQNDCFDWLFEIYYFVEAFYGVFELKAGDERASRIQRLFEAEMEVGEDEGIVSCEVQAKVLHFYSFVDLHAQLTQKAIYIIISIPATFALASLINAAISSFPMVKVCIKTQGCSHNYSDSEHMAGLLKNAGPELVSGAEDADVVLFNTCTVKTPTENAFLRSLRGVADKKIVIGGCVPQADPTRFTGYSLIGTRQLDRVVEMVERTNDGETVQLLQRTGRPSLTVVKERRNPLVETIPISLGCMSTCSFCKTKAARGVLSSYPPAEIVDAVRRATSQGVREVWLTSQDTGCYGFDIGTNLPALLKELCTISGDFKIKIGIDGFDRH